MIRSVSLVFAIVLVSNTALAQAPYGPYPHENTPEDRACRGDARRFCREDIPDQFRVGSCLQAHRDRLSRACRDALEHSGM